MLLRKAKTARSLGSPSNVHFFDVDSSGSLVCNVSCTRLPTLLGLSCYLLTEVQDDRAGTSALSALSGCAGSLLSFIYVTKL